MREMSAIFPALALIVACSSSKAEDKNQFCRDLLRQGTLATISVLPDNIYYRNGKGQIARLTSGTEVSRRSGQQFFYYAVSDYDQFQRSAALGIKYVYRTFQKLKRTQIVSLSNDRWDSYDDNRMKRISRICSNVNIDGYEAFHLNSKRNYCLSYYFHQTEPVDTLATPARRMSFAFSDMVEQPSGFETVWGIFSFSSAQAAEPRQSPETAPTSDVRSWIKNFVYNLRDANNMIAAACVEIRPEFPQRASSVFMRITNLGKISEQPRAFDWKLELAE